MKSTPIEVEGIGIVHLVPSAKARRMNLSIRSGNIIRVAMPSGYTIQQVKTFIIQHKEWIIKNRERFNQHLITKISDGHKTHFHSFEFHPEHRNDIGIRIHRGVCSVNFPEFLGLHDSHVQKAAQDALKSIYRLEAKKFLPERLNYWSNLHHLPYNDLVIKDIRSKWGSCSNRKNINLSIHLMKLPMHLIDYVLLHELTHTLEMNHGPVFKAKLNALCGGNLARFSKELKQYKI